MHRERERKKSARGREIERKRVRDGQKDRDLCRALNVYSSNRYLHRGIHSTTLSLTGKLETISFYCLAFYHVVLKPHIYRCSKIQLLYLFVAGIQFHIISIQGKLQTLNVQCGSMVSSQQMLSYLDRERFYENPWVCSVLLFVSFYSCFLVHW